MGRAHVLAELPPDISGSLGQVLTADVYSTTGTKKRKTSEISIAIDCQGVTIYDVKTSKLSTSYAISPEAVLTCPPCSSRLRAKGRPTQRLTYVSVISPKPQIVCFSETIGLGHNPATAITTSSVKIEKGTSSIVGLALLHYDDTGANNIPDVNLLAIHEDGKISCYTSDLKKAEWSTQTMSSQNRSSIPKVQYAEVVNIETARKALLKDREDILSTIGSAGEDTAGNIILMITQSATESSDGSATLSLNILNVGISSHTRSQSLPIESEPHVKSLASIVLPKPSNVFSKMPSIAIHAASGSIHCNAEGNLVVYDVTGCVPRITYEFAGQDPRSSFLRISTKLITRIDPSSLSIVALPYNSIQADCSLEKLHSALSARERPDSNFQPRLLSYHTLTDVVVALHLRKLLTVQLSAIMPVDHRSRKRKRDGLLIDSLGCVFSSAARYSSRQMTPNRHLGAIGTRIVSSFSEANWNAQKASLDSCASQSSVAQFEQKASSILGLDSPDGKKLTTDLPNHSHTDRLGSYLVLNAMFAVDKRQHHAPNEAPSSVETLKPRFLPRNLCNSLMANGLMTLSNVEKALRFSGALPVLSKLAPGALVQALVDWDSSLELLSCLITSVIPLGVEELVHALVLVSCNANAAGARESLSPMINSEDNDNDNSTKLQLTNGKRSQNTSPQRPSHEKYDHLILAAILKKLYIIPSTSVSHALRSSLSNTQLHLLIDTLRMRLAQNGWLSPYTDNLSPSSKNGNHQISHVAHMLNCAVDSIGTGGWILGISAAAAVSSRDELFDSADTIAYMKAEISAALEGIEEAVYLQGMLGEMLLCGKDTLGSLDRALRPEEEKKQMTHNNTAAPITLSLDEPVNALPLGLKVKKGVSTTKVGAGGELMKRSARDIGRQKSRMVGKYSFERIFV